MKSYCFKSVETFAQLFPKVGSVMVAGYGGGIRWCHSTKYIHLKNRKRMCAHLNYVRCSSSALDILKCFREPNIN